MPIIGTRTTVTTSPTVVITPANGSVTGPITASLLNLGPNDCDLGGEFVTPGGSYLFRVGATLDVDLISGDVLYAVTAAATTVICSIKLMS